MELMDSYNPEVQRLSSLCKKQKREIASLKKQLNQAGVELSQCILDKMEQAKQLAECRDHLNRVLSTCDAISDDAVEAYSKAVDYFYGQEEEA